MATALRLWHTADSHIGADLPARPRTSRPRRGDDLVESFGRVMHGAIEREVDLVIHAGDVFDSPRPNVRALTAAAGPMLEVAAAGIPIVIVPGNHERSAIPSTLLLAHRNIHIVTEPCTLSFRLVGVRVAVAALPCLRRRSAARFAAALAATGWEQCRADVNVLAVHQTFESATCGPGDYRFRSGDDVVERDAVPEWFDYVAAGHVHRHQELRVANGNGPAIVYSGSADRVSFAEIGEPKGAVLVEFNGGGPVHRFIEHDVRPMSTWPIDISGLSRSRILDEVQGIVGKLPDRAVAQVRLAGNVNAGVLKGLRLTAVARALRPDVVFSVWARAVEFAASSERGTPRGVRKSAFDAVSGVAGESASIAAGETKQLDDRCGVYALHALDGRLLYIGKAARLRGRVRAHLRGKSEANFFRGWSSRIARIEALYADSELEGLLVEAELVRRLLPPFNRQMRRWRGYCYLCENGAPYGQLQVSGRPDPHKKCFGPFRSRRMAGCVYEESAVLFGLAVCPEETSTPVFPLLSNVGSSQACHRYHRGQCAGPCAGCVDSATYRDRLNARERLLAGVDDTALRALEARVESSAESFDSEDTHHDLARRAKMMRMAFDYLTVVREARELLHGLILLPGRGGDLKVAIPTERGVAFDRLRRTTSDARRILRRHGALTRARGRLQTSHMPKTVVDALCVAVRQLRAAPDVYRFLSREQTGGFKATDLLATAFDGLVHHGKVR